MRTLTLFALGAGLALSCTACVHPRPPASPLAVETAQDRPLVVTTKPAAFAHIAEATPPSADDVSFYDLMQAYGLKVSIDLVTGRRTGRDGRNTVVVMPSRKWIQVNGKAYPLEAMVRWHEGVLYVPGDSRAILAEHMRTVGVERVRSDPQDFDGTEPDDLAHPHHRKYHPRHRSRSRSRHFARRPGELPRGWNIKANRRWRFIVIHHSATREGDAVSFGRYHRKKWVNGLGYDFVIGNGTTTPDGYIQVGPRWLRQNQGIDGAHAGNKLYNKYGIGICLVGDFDITVPSRTQMAALRHLCRVLMRRYHIPRSGVKPHRAVRLHATDCPGKRFPWKAFVRSL